MLPQSIIQLILAKYGKNEIYAADCELIAAAINAGHPGPIICTSTIKRLLGFASDAPTPRPNTLDIVAKWLGYVNYRELLKKIGETDVSSEFASLFCIDVKNLELGTQIQVCYEPARVIIMTYLGDGEFMVNESKNSKLQKGDKIRLTHLVLGQQLIVSEIVRNGILEGGYIGAKDGGLKSLEIIGTQG